MAPRARPIIILMLEDDNDDYELAMSSVRKDKLLNLIFRVRNGEEGISYLEWAGAAHGDDPGVPNGIADGPHVADDGTPNPVSFDKCPMPDIIIADLMMPKMDGAEFIKRIRADNRWRGLPVIVLTNSRDERDVAEAWDIGASAVIVKPVNAREMANVVKTLRDFYLSVVRLPNRG